MTIQIPEPRPFARQVFDQVERVRQHYENHYAQYEGVENPPPAPPPPPPPRPPRPRLVHGSTRRNCGTTDAWD